MPDSTSHWLYSGIVAVFGLLFGLVTRRVNSVSDVVTKCQNEHGQRVAKLEAHYTDLRDGQRRIEGKVDTIIQRM